MHEPSGDRDGAAAAGVDASAPRERVCASADLVERGDAVVFDLLHAGGPARAFALRFDGRIVAYLNRCAHIAAEMDWQPGRFLDASRELIVCAVHGAVYDPNDGRCVGGPCIGARLVPLVAGENDGEVWWQPGGDCRPIW